MATLPDDLIQEILLRLPVICLLRLKCVCKSWFTLISDPDFAKSHFDLAAAPTHRFVCFSNLSNSKAKASSVDIDAPVDNDSAQVMFNIPSPLPASIRKCGYTPMVNVAASCRGFLLLTSSSSSSNVIYFVVWNPLTGLQKRFEKVFRNLFSYHIYECGIGYNASTDDYVLVALTFLKEIGRSASVDLMEAHCFSMRNNSWSCIKDTFPHRRIGYEYGKAGYQFGQGSFVNGALYWLVYSKNHDIFPEIIAFDVIERRLSVISPPPDELKERVCNQPRLRVMGECLCLCVVNLRSQTEIWMMKEYKGQSSWSKTFVFHAKFYPFDGFLPTSFTKNGEILGHDRISVKDKGELFERCTLGLRRYDLIQFSMYRETLLSLPE